MTERLGLEGLRYARAVAQTKSFTAAARAYGVTQPALSNGIAKLEERLGERLFDRSPRGATPTAFGAQILPLVERALVEIDGMIAEARRLTDLGAVRSIRMGVSPLISPHLVARAFAAVRELPNPRDLVLREANLDELREELLAGELDALLIPSVGPMPRFEHRIIDSEPVVLIESSPTGTSPLELADTSDRQFILVPDGCGLTRFTIALFEGQEPPMRTYPGEASSYHMLEQWASLGLGVALVPESKLSSPDVPHRRLVDHGQEVEIFYTAVWDPSSALAADIASLSDTLTAS